MAVCHVLKRSTQLQQLKTWHFNMNEPLDSSFADIVSTGDISFDLGATQLLNIPSQTLFRDSNESPYPLCLQRWQKILTSLSGITGWQGRVFFFRVKQSYFFVNSLMYFGFGLFGCMCIIYSCQAQRRNWTLSQYSWNLGSWLYWQNCHHKKWEESYFWTVVGNWLCLLCCKFNMYSIDFDFSLWLILQ